VVKEVKLVDISCGIQTSVVLCVPMEYCFMQNTCSSNTYLQYVTFTQNVLYCFRCGIFDRKAGFMLIRAIGCLLTA
jgi:hypothetical protein